MARATRYSSVKSKPEMLGADVEMSTKPSSAGGTPKGKMMVIAALVLLILGVLGYKNYKMFVAATVDNRPVFTWDLNSALQKKFGAKVLDQMIDMILIRAEAKKEGIVVTKAEVEAKIKELETQVGGKDAMNQLLLSQNVSPDELNEQIELKIIVDRILEKKVAVSEKDVEDFLAKNKDSLPATDSASQKKMATDSVKQQKLSDAFQAWYQDLKKNAKIFKFY